MDQDKLDLINALASFLDMRAEVEAALCGDGVEQWRDCCMFAEAAIDNATGQGLPAPPPSS